MEEYRIRVRIFIGIILVILGILGMRLGQLQLVDVEEYAGESRSNAIKEQRVHPARGAVLDRNGLLMVDNQPSYTITITPRTFEPENVSTLARLLEVPDSLVQAKLDQARARSRYQAYKAFREVPFDIFSRVNENLYRLPGVGYGEEFSRRYHTDATASHALGYIREITERELSYLRDRGYRQGDLIGKSGIEKTYEGYLRGRLGAELKMVNVHGLEVKSYQDGRHDIDPLSGYNVHLGIDAKVQALAESLFVNKRGGAVAIDPNTGAIIAMVSKPDFDPGLFSESVDPETWDYLNNSPQKPLLNRATMNLLPPGSTWKPFMALLSLQEGNITTEGSISCPGYHPFGGPGLFRCMHVHGRIGVVEAIQRSCNTFFFETMMRTNVNTFNKYAHMFGFGEQAPTDIGEQTPGLIPDSTYFYSRWGEAGLKPGFTLSLGIGQGNMGVTPLQLARFMAAVGNKGTLYPPHLVTKLEHPETGEVFYPSLPAPREIPIEERYFEVVKQGMKQVMEAGTGYWIQIPNIPSGGKTGTAQNPRGKDDSVFIMFAPFENPQIAIAVQVENAGYGATAAGPIASFMAEQYLTGKISDDPQRQNRLNAVLNVRSDPLPKQ